MIRDIGLIRAGIILRELYEAHAQAVDTTPFLQLTRSETRITYLSLAPRVFSSFFPVASGGGPGMRLGLPHDHLHVHLVSEDSVNICHRDHCCVSVLV